MEDKTWDELIKELKSWEDLWKDVDYVSMLPEERDKLKDDIW